MNDPVPHNTDNLDESRWLIHSRTEIVFLLRGIMRHSALITAYFNAGKHFVLTSILHVDPDNDALLLDMGPDEELNEKLFAAERVLFITTHERVKVKFSAKQAKRVQFEGRTAFRVTIPKDLLRLQRREFYRVSTPITKPLKCAIPVTDEEGETVAEVVVLDISCGGIALMDQHPNVNLEPGNGFSACHLTLPDVGTITADLTVCNTYEASLKNGLVYKRSGCQFIGMRESDRGLIQRYITKLEREKVR